jgi:hypothetical protein
VASCWLTTLHDPIVGTDATISIGLVCGALVLVWVAALLRKGGFVFLLLLLVGGEVGGSIVCFGQYDP